MGDKDKRSTNGHIMYVMIHPSLYLVFNTDCNGMRHFSKTNGVRERWIFMIKSSTGVRRANYFYSSSVATDKSLSLIHI